MLKTISLTIAGLALVAVLLFWPSAEPPALSPSGSSVWSILNGTPVHVDDKGKTFFVFPTVSPGVNYLTRPVSGLPVGLSLVSIAYTITATGAPIFNYRTNRNNTCGPGFPQKSCSSCTATASWRPAAAAARGTSGTLRPGRWGSGRRAAGATGASIAAAAKWPTR